MSMMAFASLALLIACDRGVSSTPVATLAVHGSSAILRSDILPLIRAERLDDLVSLLRSERPNATELAALRDGESMVVLLKGSVSRGQTACPSMPLSSEPADEWVLVAEFAGMDLAPSAVDLSSSSQLIFAVWSTEGPRVPYCVGRIGRGEINLKGGMYEFSVSALETGSLAKRSDCENLSLQGIAESTGQ